MGRFRFRGWFLKGQPKCLACSRRPFTVDALCAREMNVSELIDRLGVAQANISQHLSLLYRSGMLDQAARRSPGLLPGQCGTGAALVRCSSKCDWPRGGIERRACERFKPIRLWPSDRGAKTC